MAKRNLSQHKITGFLKQIKGTYNREKIPLYDFDVIIGRSKKADIVSPDPNVSRNHCSLKYSESGWSIKDLFSVNGTYVNNSRISSTSYVPLIEGSSIYFGPPEEAPEGYIFEIVKPTEEPSQNEIQRKRLRLKTPSPQKKATTRPSKRKVSSQVISATNNTNKNTMFVEVNCNSGSNMNSKPPVFNVDQDNYAEDGYHSDSSISSLDSLRTRIRKAESAQKRKIKKMKFDNGNEIIGVPSTSTSHPFGVKSSLDKFAFLGLNSDDEDSESLLNKDAFTECNTDYNDNKGYNAQVISPIKNFEDLLSDSEPKSVSVHTDLLKALQKKVEDLKKNLKNLNMDFSDIKDENTKLSEALKSKENAAVEVKEDFKRLLEDELICQICTELYIKPVTLGCSHTFCHYCISEWKKKKKQCPMCRERIEVETKVLFIDNFVNKAVEKLDPVGLEKRQELIKKREEVQTKKPKRKKSKGRARRRNVPNVEPAPDIILEEDDDDEVEILRSRISDIQSYTSDIQAYVDVIDDLINDRYDDEDQSYYGRCFNCGRTGHWANVCPF